MPLRGECIHVVSGLLQYGIFGRSRNEGFTDAMSADN